MDNLITLKIKATSFDRLIDEFMNIKKAPCTKTRSTKKLKASKFYHERTELKIWKL